MEWFILYGDLDKKNIIQLEHRQIIIFQIIIFLSKAPSLKWITSLIHKYILVIWLSYTAQSGKIYCKN